VSFVIEFEECWTVGVMFLEMEVMYLWLIGCVPTFFTHVHLRPTFLICILMLDSMYFKAVGLK
jgi:hypothetical protein